MVATRRSRPIASPQSASKHAAESLGGVLLRDDQDNLEAIRGLDAVVATEALADVAVAHPASFDAAIDGSKRIDQATWRRLDRDRRALHLVRRSSIAAAIAEADRHVRRSIGWASTVMLALASIAGAGAAAAALPAQRDTPVNIFLLLGGYLGIQTVLLLAWLIAAVALRGGGPSLGRAVAAIAAMFARWGGPRTSRDAAATELPHAMAIAAVLRRRLARESSGPAARWGIGLASNALWTAFNIAGLATAIALLATRQYEFAWESTILSTESTLRLTETIATMPPRLGFPVPDAATIAASRFDPSSPQAFLPQDDSVRAAWSGLLLGSIVCYALAPRLALAAFCGWRRRTALSSMRIDRGDPAIAMLLARLGEPSEAPIEGDGVLPAAPNFGAEDALAARDVGPPAIAGLELPVPGSGWPPELGLAIDDLGLLASREDRQRARARLRAAAHRPATLVVVCDAAATPDRGVRAMLAELCEASAAPLLLAISRGEALRRRESPANAAQRLADWRSLAEALDARLAEIDLDHLTAASRTALRAAIESHETATPAATLRIDKAFAEIAAAAERWIDADRTARLPTVEEEAELHRRIAQRLGGRLLDAARFEFSARDAIGSIRRAASQVESLLPASLRMRPAWLGAGAVAGALGCLAAAAFATPLAISALPMWAAFGGGLGGLLSTWRGPGAMPTADAGLDFGPAVAAAAMQAVLLAHQGLGEDRIGAALAAAFAPEEPPRLGSAREVRAWLSLVSARLAAARTTEAPR